MSHIKAFEDRSGGFIFVRVPGEYGRYVRTNHSVAFVACPACGSGVCVPCVGNGKKFTGSIHADRLVAANKFLRENGVNVNSHNVSGEEHPVMREDVLGDDEPGVVSDKETGVVDLRGLWR